jgi:hypothetical protein
MAYAHESLGIEAGAGRAHATEYVESSELLDGLLFHRSAVDDLRDAGTRGDLEAWQEHREANGVVRSDIADKPLAQPPIVDEPYASAAACASTPKG